MTRARFCVASLPWANGPNRKNPVARHGESPDEKSLCCAQLSGRGADWHDIRKSSSHAPH